MDRRTDALARTGEPSARTVYRKAGSVMPHESHDHS